MAQFFPVGPLHVMEALNEAGGLKQGCLVLAHKVVEDPQGWHRLLLKAPVQTVILDNGTAEFGKPVDDSVMIAAFDALNGKGLKIIVVLPDVYEDTDGTIKATQRALQSWPRIFPEGFHSYMFVPQGKTETEFLRCVETVLKREGTFYYDGLISWFGIPRNVANNHGTRERIVRLCKTIAPDLGIHLLGFSDNVPDDILTAQHPAVTSIDSSVPLRAAFEERPLELWRPRKHDTGWWDMKYTKLAHDNIRTARKWVQGPR